MLIEHIGQIDRPSLLVEKLVSTSFPAHRQCPTLPCNPLDMTPELDFFDKERLARRTV